MLVSQLTQLDIQQGCKEFRYILFVVNGQDLILGTDSDHARQQANTVKPVAAFTSIAVEDRGFVNRMKSQGILPTDCSNTHQTTTNLLRSVGDEWIMKQGKYYFRNAKPKYLPDPD